ncbi:MAG: hypothetical protein M1324_03740 [Patescibacteria group bacterium]|nr:hypothetical protein [Patescibacteria group bacterium]
MACFLAPAATAIVTTAANKKIPKHYHMDWLLAMQWGGVVMLIIDHIANKEIVPYFPFFTAGWSKIWPEILKNGVPMTVGVFVLWFTAIQISWLIEKKKLKISQANA